MRSYVILYNCEVVLLISQNEVNVMMFMRVFLWFEDEGRDTGIAILIVLACLK